jgi:hypothetical protein
MSIEVPEKQLKAQPEAGLADRLMEEAKVAEARARRAIELANEEAIKAKESAARSAKATKELAQEAKRKARAAQIAALKAKRGTKLAAKLVKEAKETESKALSRSGMTTSKEMNGKAAVNGIAEQAKANLAKELELESKGIVDKEAGSVKGEVRKETEAGRSAVPANAAASAAKEAKWLSSELLEGEVHILLQRPNAQQVLDLKKALRSVQNLRVVLATGSMDGTGRIIVLAEQPVPLIDILGRLPLVDKVTQIGWREIQLSLKKQ